MTAPENMIEAVIVCGNWFSATMLVSTAPMSVNSARFLSGLSSKPTGFCMNELAARMKYADSQTPRTVIQMVAR